MQRLPLLLMSLLWVPLPACLDRTQADAEVAVRLLTDAAPGERLSERAVRELARLGRGALPVVESALHGASASGRRGLVAALGAIEEASGGAADEAAGDRDGGACEVCPLLGHLACHDADPEVQRASRRYLEQWAAQRGGRGKGARRVLEGLEGVGGLDVESSGTFCGARR